ncbi:MAG: site-specific DNA-methyltransferase [Gallionella sp.]|nr:site-specific DNA-methyltransferase [Gallionella sp.]
MSENTKNPRDVTIAKAKGRPMLTWVGKKPLARITAYPAQTIERFELPSPASGRGGGGEGNLWSDWPKDMPQGGLLYHGDNKDVLARLLADGFRGKVKLIYIDPPFDSGAEYVRQVHLRGIKGTVKIDGEDYALGEQIQYNDIWANDSYLQFMYERLLIAKELLAENGSFVLHCDSSRSHHLRCLLDEVFGADKQFKNEIIWFYRRWPTNSKAFQSMHDNLLWYTKNNDNTHVFNKLYEAASDRTLSDYGGKRLTTLTSDDGTQIKRETEEESLGVPMRDVWEIRREHTRSHEHTDYPTQKPLELVERILTALSNQDDLILDCFVGSGTTAVAAQKLGRRWIGCDINKGAIQTTAKRLQGVMQEQAAALNARQGELVATENAPPKPCQLSFSTWRVNDYDLQIQHNEAVELACQHLGVTRTRTDPYFDGTQGGRLVKIVPFNHPLTPLDMEALRAELKTRPNEERDVMLVSLGIEQSARKWMEDYNRNRPINKLHLVELRTDRKYGGIIKHEPMSADIAISREADKLLVEIRDVVSPTIIQRLNLQEGVFRAQIADWRAVVDCVLIDTQNNGEVFNIALSDVPERKQDLVNGRYELPSPPSGSTVAVKIIDMLGEEFLMTYQVG